MKHDLLERKKKLIGKRSNRNQEFWMGAFFFVIGLFLIPFIIGIFLLLPGIVLILYAWEAKSKIDQELAEINFKLNKEPKESKSDEDPLKILKVRYSKGEITKKAYEEMKKGLEI